MLVLRRWALTRLCEAWPTLLPWAVQRDLESAGLQRMDSSWGLRAVGKLRMLLLAAPRCTFVTEDVSQTPLFRV